MTNFKIIQKRKVWLGISVVLFVVFVAALFIWGFKSRELANYTYNITQLNKQYLYH